MKKYTENKYVIGSLILLAVCVILAAVSGTGGNTPAGAVRRLEAAYQSPSDKKLLNCYNSDLAMEYKMTKKFDPGTSLADILGIDGRKIEIMVSATDMKAETEAAVSCIQIITEKKSKQEQVVPTTLNVIKENGKWVVKY